MGVDSGKWGRVLIKVSYVFEYIGPDVKGTPNLTPPSISPTISPSQPPPPPKPPLKISPSQPPPPPQTSLSKYSTTL